MASPERIEDPADPRVASYRSLRDAALRRAQECAQGLFVAEGKLVVRRLLSCGLCVRSVLLAENRVGEFRDEIAATTAAVYIGSQPVINAVAGFNIHRGVLALGERPPQRRLHELLGFATVAVLDEVNDHENLGAIARSAAALGVDALVLSPGCCDPLSRRALRVSVGALLTLPTVRSTAWPCELDALGAAGFECWAFTPAGGAPLPHDVPAKVAVLLGAEGPGLSSEALARADRLVGIAMQGGMDSLNVAATAAIAFHHLAARRSSAGARQ